MSTDNAHKRTDDFILTEYVQLKKEVTMIVNKIELIERTLVIGSALIWLWLAVNEWQPMFRFLVCLPVILTILFYLEKLSLRFALKELSAYIIQTENYFLHAKVVGWEHHMERNEVQKFNILSTLFWLGVFVFNLLFAILSFVFV